ncbi:MAG: sulfite oxidase [Pseudomonadota bacterium]
MDNSRRQFLKSAGGIVVAVPAFGWSLASASSSHDKPGLRVLNERPLNAETPAHLLNDDVTPTKHLFVRNNGLLPTVMDADNWTLSVNGESCLKPMSFSIQELKQTFRQVTLDLQLECGGNGRAEFRPRAAGNQWTTGAVGCPRWTGVRLKDVLEFCGVKDDARYVAYKGADRHLSGDPNKTVISRGVPVAKAMEAESLIAFALNGEPISPLHGAPLRLVIGGWPGSVSGKWLTTLMVRDRVHDGPKMNGNAYRVPCEPVAPGSDLPEDAMCIIESMPVKSVITNPRSGLTVSSDKRLRIAGKAWAGDLKVDVVHTSCDFGATWQQAELAAPANRLAWQSWQADVRLPSRGYHEIFVRATDELGRSQPMLVPNWNPKGYLNNACHRIAVQAV